MSEKNWSAKDILPRSRIACPPVTEGFRLVIGNERLQRRLRVPPGSFQTKRPTPVAFARARVFANESPVTTDLNVERDEGDCQHGDRKE